jgi:hypothetical protein
MTLFVKFAVRFVVHFQPADAVAKEYAAAARIVKCELIQFCIVPSFLAGNHRKLRKKSGSLNDSVFKKVGGVVIFDFTRDSASERGRIKSSDGSNPANTPLDGLPKSFNSDTDGTNDSHPCNGDTTHSEFLSLPCEKLPYEKRYLTKTDKMSTPSILALSLHLSMAFSRRFQILTGA